MILFKISWKVIINNFQILIYLRMININLLNIWTKIYKNNLDRVMSQFQNFKEKKILIIIFQILYLYKILFRIKNDIICFSQYIKIKNHVYLYIYFCFPNLQKILDYCYSIKLSRLSHIFYVFVFLKQIFALLEQVCKFFID